MNLSNCLSKTVKCLFICQVLTAALAVAQNGAKEQKLEQLRSSIGVELNAIEGEINSWPNPDNRNVKESRYQFAKLISKTSDLFKEMRLLTTLNQGWEAQFLSLASRFNDALARSVDVTRTKKRFMLGTKEIPLFDKQYLAIFSIFDGMDLQEVVKVIDNPHTLGFWDDKEAEVRRTFVEDVKSGRVNIHRAKALLYDFQNRSGYGYSGFIRFDIGEIKNEWQRRALVLSNSAIHESHEHSGTHKIGASYLHPFSFDEEMKAIGRIEDSAGLYRYAWSLAFRAGTILSALKSADSSYMDPQVHPYMREIFGVRDLLANLGFMTPERSQILIASLNNSFQVNAIQRLAKLAPYLLPRNFEAKSFYYSYSRQPLEERLGDMFFGIDTRDMYRNIEEETRLIEDPQNVKSLQKLVSLIATIKSETEFGGFLDELEKYASNVMTAADYQRLVSGRHETPSETTAPIHGSQSCKAIFIYN